MTWVFFAPRDSHELHMGSYATSSHRRSSMGYSGRSATAYFGPEWHMRTVVQVATLILKGFPQVLPPPRRSELVATDCVKHPQANASSSMSVLRPTDILYRLSAARHTMREVVLVSVLLVAAGVALITLSHIFTPSSSRASFLATCPERRTA
ncbi:hypothetical protein BC827DRAFT_1210458 [Russula dissimulans]|nr:hypothetical protein BC827DRAFT_1210458 [Russula dissimulans]